jgi:sulfite reductase (NADPH) hemoprotein beta-component
LENPKVEPIYGKTYLPRKFKIAVALPPRNDVDVFTNCLGFVGIPDGEKIIGYNVLVGGGLGMTHGKTATFQDLRMLLGFVNPNRLFRSQKKWLKYKEIMETVLTVAMPV